MDRTQKQQIATALHDDLAETVCVVVTHQTGLTVDEVTQLRRQMRNAGARYRVTKNRLARRALEGTPFANLATLFTSSWTYTNANLATAFGNGSYTVYVQAYDNAGNPQSASTYLTTASSHTFVMTLLFGLLLHQAR